MYHYQPRRRRSNTRASERREETEQKRRQEPGRREAQETPEMPAGGPAPQPEGLPVLDTETLRLVLLLLERVAQEAEEASPLEREEDRVVESDPSATGKAAADERRPLHRPARRRSTRLPLVLGVLCALSLLAVLVSVVLLPLLTASATVTIIPTTVSISATSTVSVVTTGSTNTAPAPQHDQVPGRVLSSLTLSQVSRIATTGRGFQPATAGHGSITFYNAEPANQVVPAGTLLTGADGAQVVTNEQATLPPAVYPTFGQVTVSAQATISGPAGNIQAGDIYGPCCRLNLSAANGAFTGGQNARSYPMVIAQDISGVAAPLKSSLLQSAQAAFATELRPSETLLPPVCTPTIVPDHAVGEEAARLTVTVNETCRGEAYDTQALHDLVTQVVTREAVRHLGTGYVLTGDVQVTVVTATSTRRDQFPVLQVKGRGTWSYQFDATQLYHLAQLIQGKSKAQATQLLLHIPGVNQVAMNVSGGSSRTTLPSNANSIHVLVLYQAG